MTTPPLYGRGPQLGDVDLIKVVQERGGRRRTLQPIAPEVLRAIVDEAHAHGLPVAAHWGSPEDLDDVLAAGVDDLEHIEPRGVLDGWPGDTLAVLVERDISLTPTLAVTDVVLPPETTRVLRQRAGEFHAAGGRVVAGSDAGMPGVPFGGGLHRELAATGGEWAHPAGGAEGRDRQGRRSPRVRGRRCHRARTRRRPTRRGR